MLNLDCSQIFGHTGNFLCNINTKRKESPFFKEANIMKVEETAEKKIISMEKRSLGPLSLAIREKTILPPPGFLEVEKCA